MARKVPKTGAERMREYRARIRSLENAAAAGNLEDMHVYIRQQDLHFLAEAPTTSATQMLFNTQKVKKLRWSSKPAKTSKERSRAYRERKKALKNATDQKFTIDTAQIPQEAINVGPHGHVVEPPSTSTSSNSMYANCDELVRQCTNILKLEGRVHVISNEILYRESKEEKNEIDTDIDDTHYSNIELTVPSTAIAPADTTVLKYEIDIDDAKYSDLELNDPGREAHKFGVKFTSLDAKLTATYQNPSTIPSFSKVSVVDTSTIKYEIDDAQYSDIDLNECSSEFISLNANEKQATTNQNPTTISSTTLGPPVETSIVKHETDVDDTEYSNIELNDQSSEFIYLDTSIQKHNTPLDGTKYCGIELNGPNDKQTDCYDNPTIISNTASVPLADTSILKFEIDVDTQHSDIEFSGPGTEVASLGANENPTTVISNAKPVPHIANYQDAMLFLKALEEFSMLKDNFLAISLLKQVEQVLIEID